MDRIDERIRSFKRQTLLVLALYTVGILTAFAGVIVYYELKIRSVVGYVYQNDSNGSNYIIKALFNGRIDSNAIDMAEVAMVENGYTSKGFSYLFGANNQIGIIVSILIVAIVAFFIANYLVRRVCDRSIIGNVSRISVENEKLKRELEINKAYSEKRNRLMTEFVENIAHQVKTPLAAMSLSLDTISEENEDTGLKKYIEQCFFHIERINTFIKRLLNISRMEAGKVIMASESIDIKELISGAIESVGINEEKVNVRLEEEINIYGDDEWLGEGIVAILSNSYEYVRTKDNGKLYIDAKCSDDKCIINISDNGEGFKNKDITHIFDRFESQNDSDSFHVGIGLNLAKLIFEAHHGNIYAFNSEMYGGASFMITLPKYVLKEKTVVR